MTKLGKDLIQAANEAREMIWNEDLEILKHKLKTLLKDNIMEVTFTKVDGTTREMKCTLKPTLLPGQNSILLEAKHPENILAVWDVEKNAWRSFRIDRVLDYITTKGEA